jgi:hypothetical protein
VSDQPPERETEEDAWEYWHQRCIKLEATLYALRQRIELDGASPWPPSYILDVIGEIDDVLRPRWGIK